VSATLGQQVRSAREAAGLSLREFARRAGLTPSYLSDIEHDRRRPSEATWKAITLRLNVYGGALVDAKVDALERDEPNVYAAIFLRGMTRGRANAEQDA
jgi:transcriptional regulator with XRE-family HTH domain